MQFLFEKSLYIQAVFFLMSLHFLHDWDRYNVDLYIPLFDKGSGDFLFFVMIQKRSARKRYLLFDWLIFRFMTDNVDTLYTQRIKESFCHAQ